MKIQAFNFSANLMRSILWQYEGAEKAVQLARNEQAWFNTAYTEFWNNWYKDVFNLDTANTFGLSVWSRILGLRLEIDAEVNDEDVFGFADDDENFDNGNFAASQGDVIAIDTESARTLLKMRWFQITRRPTAPNINEALNNIFGEGEAYVADNYDMTITYVFKSAPDYKLMQLLEHTEILPRPSGVKLVWMVITEDYFGFADDDENFDNGVFGA